MRAYRDPDLAETVTEFVLPDSSTKTPTVEDENFHFFCLVILPVDNLGGKFFLLFSSIVR